MRRTNLNRNRNKNRNKNQSKKNILDMCCGSKMFWFDKTNPNTVYGDIRNESHVLCDNRKLFITPEVVFDFKNLCFKDNTFDLVVFDPPHLKVLGENSWMYKKYGKLSETWKYDIQKGFSEAFRVLKTNGVLIFKWNEDQISVSEILKLTDKKPLFGNRSGKRSNTHYITFMNL